MPSKLQIEWIICTFPALILKLYVLQELFPFKGEKTVPFIATFSENNIQFFHEYCWQCSCCNTLWIFYLLFYYPLIFTRFKYLKNYEKIILNLFILCIVQYCYNWHHFVRLKRNDIKMHNFRIKSGMCKTYIVYPIVNA